MLEYSCIFCGDENLTLRQVEAKIYQVNCSNCGSRGSEGSCLHEADWKYRDVVNKINRKMTEI